MPLYPVMPLILSCPSFLLCLSTLSCRAIARHLILPILSCRAPIFCRAEHSEASLASLGTASPSTLSCRGTLPFLSSRGTQVPRDPSGRALGVTSLFCHAERSEASPLRSGRRPQGDPLHLSFLYFRR